MYFPDDMTFQYFFFDTYIGYFLQALPIALIVGAVYGIIKFRKDKETPFFRKLFSCAFVCYITGLLCLVVGFDLMHTLWYNILYPWNSSFDIAWFGGWIDLVPDFFNNLSAESIGNFLMFCPFGILYPLTRKDPAWKKSVLTGLITVAAIEIVQPIFGRAFDMNDIILNSLGILASTSIFFGIKKAVKK